MKHWRPAATLFAIGAIFLLTNTSAYRGYFQDDELTNIVLIRTMAAAQWVNEFLTPKLHTDNFRPAGYLYFFLVHRMAQLDFAQYVIPIHLLHLLNGLLLWLFLRRVGIGLVGCAAGVAFFLLNVAAFDAYWKPMYVFDVLCTTFCLAALLLYAAGYWLAALPMMWLAFKSKELAVMLPVALTAFEYTFGQRNWKRLIPFFLISANFGVQALLANTGPHTDYSFVFTAQALGKTLKFYSSRLLVLPFAGVVFVAFPLVFRNKRMFLGLAMLATFFLPLLFLPGRLFAAYCYLPLTGAALEIAGLAEIIPPAWTLALFLIWAPWNFYHLRNDAKVTLALDSENRTYVQGLMAYVRTHPQLPKLAVTQRPDNFHSWGVEAALSYPASANVGYMEEREARALPASTAVTFLNWDRRRKKLFVISRDLSTPDLSYLNMDARTPPWQLEEGWYPFDDYFRWIAPHATARLYRPAGATAFEAVLNISPAQIQKYGYTKLQVSLDGKVLGAKRFQQPGIEKVRWDLPKGGIGFVQVAFYADPAGVYPPDPRVLGAAVVSFGMVTP